MQQGWGQVLFCSIAAGCTAHQIAWLTPMMLAQSAADSEQCPLTPDGPAREMLQYKTWPPARALSYGEDSGFSRTLSSLQCRHWPAHNPCIAGLARALMRGGVTVSLAHSFLKLRSHHERVHPG